ncbi:MAG: tetratricopeptide repeat protein [Gammaproteobacteria bacterium]
MKSSNPNRLWAAIGLSASLISASPLFANHDSVSETDDKATDEAVANKVDLQMAEQAIEAKDFAKAIAVLKPLADAGKADADVFNLLGFSHRKLGQYDIALDYYQRALALDPKHKGANEYLGELYVETKQLAKAEERLKILASICADCEEYRELKEAIASSPQSQ